MTVRDLNITRITNGPGTRHSRSVFSIVMIVCVGISIGLGALATSEHGPKVTEILLVFAAVIMLVWRFGLGAWLSLLVLGAVDALPGPELETIETPMLHLYVSDALIVLLVFTLLVDNYRDNFRHLADTRVRRVLCIWSGALLLLWLVTVARSYGWAEIPLTHAMDYGRDFAFFAILLPLFAATLVRPRVRRVLLTTLAISVVVIDATEIISTVSHRVLTFWVHAHQLTVEVGGITRLYVDSQYLSVVAVMLGVGLLFLAQERRLRLLGALLSLLSIAAVALERTRAQYVGGIAGLTVALIVWLLFNPRSARFGRRRIAQLLLILVTCGGVIALAQPPQITNSALGGVEARFSSVTSALSSNSAATSTVVYREKEASALEQVLGSSWVFGLGFLDPRNHYVVGLRNGSIRNGDVGVLNAVMTMGIVGAAFIYFPLVFILVGLIRSAVIGTERPRESWITFGIAAWIVSTLVSSVTLVSLFSSSGVCIAALALGIGTTCLAPATADATERSSRFSKYSKYRSWSFDPLRSQIKPSE
jgi:hypothetical protein